MSIEKFRFDQLFNNSIDTNQTFALRSYFDTFKRDISVSLFGGLRSTTLNFAAYV